MSVIFQLIDEHLMTCGMFDCLETAISEAETLHTKTGKLYQVNRIPLNKVGNYGEVFDVAYHVWC